MKYLQYFVAMVLYYLSFIGLYYYPHRLTSIELNGDLCKYILTVDNLTKRASLNKQAEEKEEEEEKLEEITI